MSAAPPTIPRERFLEIERLFEAGLSLKAYEVARPFGPLQSWRGAAEEVLAGRLAQSLGAARLGFSIHLRAGRRHRDVPLVRYHHVRAWWRRRGPLRAWR